MRYAVLATDFDGTLAHNGVVAATLWDALERVAASGRRIVLVTGRLLADLLPLLAHPQRFAAIVVENGAVLYDPATGTERTLVEPPPDAFAAELRRRGVAPLEEGRVIVATWEPHERDVLDVIRDLGLEWHVIFNKGAVMALPSGVTKATGLQTALRDLNVSQHNLVAIGDGENDGAMLSFAECGVAVANAIPMLKEYADLVTMGDHGAGVNEVIDGLLKDDLATVAPVHKRHAFALGTDLTGSEVTIDAAARGVLVIGGSGGGKSTLTTLFLERVDEAAYQFCAVDPEGDYESFEGAVVLGNTEMFAAVDDVRDALRGPERSIIVNLLAVPSQDRPSYFARLARTLAALRAEVGRPHWIVVDEAHHFIPADADTSLDVALSPAFLITTHPKLVQTARLREVDTVVAFGSEAPERLAEVLATMGFAPPPCHFPAPADEHALLWSASSSEVREVQPAAARTQRIRHRRKYATGDLAEEKSFYFRGPDGRLKLRAQNLMTFVQMAQGVDDETWLYHLRRGDYTRWFKEMIGDNQLADEARGAERDPESTPESSRRRILGAVMERYTIPA